MAAAPQFPNSVPKLNIEPTTTTTTTAGIGERAAPPRIAQLPPKRGRVLKGIANSDLKLKIKPTAGGISGAEAALPRIGRLPPKRGRVLKGILKMAISALCFRP
ncbi:hypothetical protein NE237_007895 [Protea cynaroides]|uniref:Uncharacterized protein n=1 Tax=Protea cynaroides TaxID=273540 RepID=A0A9Q0KR36_9MAGN|nr:hypothetical protein NE237_007895 [Protea cynaroides]